MRRREREDFDTTSGRIRGSTPELQAAARELRRRMTPAEQVLWEELRGQKLAGLRFRRQHPVGPFILDFACPERLLAVELDGSVHLGQQEQDAARTATLEDYGWHVIRFANELVFSELPAVVSTIESVARSRPIARGWNAGPA
jgi:very-short-patch-repair endonuclease